MRGLCDNSENWKHRFHMFDRWKDLIIAAFIKFNSRLKVLFGRIYDLSIGNQATERDFTPSNNMHLSKNALWNLVCLLLAGISTFTCIIISVSALSLQLAELTAQTLNCIQEENVTFACQEKPTLSSTPPSSCTNAVLVSFRRYCNHHFST